jgi:hypothetical protein
MDVQHGFERTVCGCAFCQAPCRHVPGSLDVADLHRLCPANADVFAWAELHLRALTDKDVPTLVPARQENGHCHWYLHGQCAVHGQAPYSCAYFDTHMPDDEVRRRSAATLAARRDDAASGGLYTRVWRHLCRQGMTARSGDRDALAHELRQVRHSLEEALRRRSP